MNGFMRLCVNPRVFHLIMHAYARYIESYRTHMVQQAKNTLCVPMMMTATSLHSIAAWTKALGTPIS